MLTRRHFIAASGALVAPLTGPAVAAAPPLAALPEAFAALERDSGGRLGVALLDTRSGATAAYRAEERFPLTSTFKLLAAGAILARVDAGEIDLQQRVVFQESDLVPASPATRLRVGGEGMSLAELCAAAITLSDNTAGNMLLRVLGGPEGLNAYLRKSGDATTRLDRIEIALNEALPGDVRDTTTPQAMLRHVHRLALGDGLSAASRGVLVGWLTSNKTGNERMRARLPAGWTVGDKTGLGERGTMNDVGVIWPPDGAPILLAIYLTNSEAPAPKRAAVHQEVGRMVAAALRG